jgi:hypothetical protein
LVLGEQHRTRDAHRQTQRIIEADIVQGVVSYPLMAYRKGSRLIRSGGPSDCQAGNHPQRDYRAF